MSNSKKIIVLGANGQLGSAICRWTASDKIEVIPVTRDIYEASSNEPSGALNEFKSADYLINTIAFHKTDLCETEVELSFFMNSIVVSKLSKFCTENNITMIHISTDYVFDGKKQKPYNESDRAAPLNVYGLSKLIGERSVEAYCANYFILRVSSLFGPKDTKDTNYNFVEKILHSASEGKTLKVINDQYMSPTYTKDVALAIKAIIDQNCINYGIYHCSGSGSCSWFEFAEKIFELTNQQVEIKPIRFTDFHSDAKRPQYCSMDNSKLSNIYKMNSWQDALKDYLSARGTMTSEDN